MFSGFMVNAWLISTVVAIIAGVVGFFVVLRGVSSRAELTLVVRVRRRRA